MAVERKYYEQIQELEEENQQLKKKLQGVYREILSQEPTDPIGIELFQRFTRFDLEELTKNTFQTKERDSN